MKNPNDSNVANYVFLAATIGLLLAATAPTVKAYLNKVEVRYPAPETRLVPHKAQADGASVTACGLKLTRHSPANDNCYVKQADGSWRLVTPQIKVGGAL